MAPGEEPLETQKVNFATLTESIAYTGLGLTARVLELENPRPLLISLTQETVQQDIPVDGNAGRNTGR